MRWYHAPYPWRNTSMRPKVEEEHGSIKGIVVTVDPKGVREAIVYVGSCEIRAMRAAQARILGILSGAIVPEGA